MAMLLAKCLWLWRLWRNVTWPCGTVIMEIVAACEVMGRTSGEFASGGDRPPGSGPGSGVKVTLRYRKSAFGATHQCGARKFAVFPPLSGSLNQITAATKDRLALFGLRAKPALRH